MSDRPLTETEAQRMFEAQDEARANALGRADELARAAQQEPELELFEAPPHELVERRPVALTEIDSTDHVDLRPALLRNIRTLGYLINNVVLTERADGKPYRIDAGSHRIRAVRELGWHAVPALVFPIGTSAEFARAIASSENMIRERNIVAELEAIEKMLEQPGVSRRDLSDRLGIDGKRLNKLLRLTALDDDLRFRLATGLMAPGVAFAAARLPRSKQKALAELPGTITAGHVRAQHERQEQPEQLIPLVGGRPGGVDLPANATPVQRAQTFLALAKSALLEAGEPYDAYAGDLAVTIDQLTMMKLEQEQEGTS